MNKEYYSLGIEETLTIVFIVLKLVKVISWSWWWVLSPIWISLAVRLVIAIIIAAIKTILDKEDDNE